MSSVEQVTFAAEATGFRRIAKLAARKQWRGDRYLVKISGADGRAVVLPGEVSKGLSADKVYVPAYLQAWLGTTGSIELASSSGSALQSISLVAEVDSLDESESVKSYLAKTVTGFILRDSEPLLVSVFGKARRFTVQCEPSSGIVTKDTSLTVKKEKAVNEQSAAGFKNVGGLSHVINELVSLIKLPLTQPDKYKLYGVTPPKGILLFGPPGTGKSLLASSLSVELPTTLVVTVKATELTGIDSDRKIHQLFSSVRGKEGFTSALIFIDEIDALCPARDSAGEAERRAVAALLTEMDGADPRTIFPIIVLGATNRPNSIDIALRRAGRFERELEVGVPNVAGRADILRVLIARQFAGVSVVSDEEVNQVASVTHGFVGADLKALLTRASSSALESGEKLTLSTIMSSLKLVKPSALKELFVEIPKTKWSDIGGYSTVKQQLIEAVQWPTRHAQAFKQLGISPPAGVLLYGPPGCSKTMLARAVATESEMNFVSVKGPELFSKWVGESEQAIRDLFRKARQAAPCIVFFDEVDAVGSDRGQSGAGVSDRVLAQLLTELDGVSSINQVVLIAATNRPEVLDAALIRPGRLDRLVHVGLPDEEAREQIWSAYLSKVSHDLPDDAARTLAARTHGYTGAECVMVSREAAMLKIRENIEQSHDLVDQLERLTLSDRPDVLEMRHFDFALEKVKPRVDAKLIQHYMQFEAAHTSNTK